MTESQQTLFQLSGRESRYDVRPHETLLTAALRHGLALPMACRSAGCGVCRASLVQGEVSELLPPAALPDTERNRGDILMCRGVPRTDVVIDIPQLSPSQAVLQRWMRTTIVESRWITPSVLKLGLSHGGGFRYLAGQYLLIRFDDGRRSAFSIANAPLGDILDLHIRINPGSRMAGIAKARFLPGLPLDIEGPFGGLHLLAHSRRPIVMIAGGTGITPMLAMLEQSFSMASDRPIQLYWGARDEQDLYFGPQLREWQDRFPQFRYTPVVSEPGPDWQGATGQVLDAIPMESLRRLEPDLYLSGPPAMVRACKSQLIEQGLSPGQLLHDAFDAPPPSQPSPA